MSSRKKGVVFSYILLFIEVNSSLLFTPFLIKTLGPSEFGIYVLINSITAYLALLDLGVGNAIIRYMAKFHVNNDKNGQQNFLAAGTLFYGGVGLIAIIIGIVIQELIPSIFSKGLSASEITLSQLMFNITMLSAAVKLLFSIFDKTIIAFEKFVVSKSISIISIVLRVGLSVIVMVLGGKSIAIVTVNLIVTILVGVTSSSYVLFKLNIKPKFKGISFKFIREVILYSSFILIQMIATQINAMANQLLIGIIITSSAAIIGIYALGAQVSQYFQSIAGSINGVIMPGIVRLVENNVSKQEILNEMIRISRYVFIILGLIWTVFLVYGHDFINLWVGPNNLQAYWVGLIIMFPMTLSLSQSVGSQILWAMNQVKIQAYLKIGVTVLNIILSIFLIKWNPIIGAALGGAITILFGDVIVMNIVYRNIIQIPVNKYYFGIIKGVLPCLALSGLVGYSVKFIGFNGWLGFVLNCSVMIITYFIGLFLFGATNNEKKLIMSLIKINR